MDDLVAKMRLGCPTGFNLGLTNPCQEMPLSHLRLSRVEERITLQSASDELRAFIEKRVMNMNQPMLHKGVPWPKFTHLSLGLGLGFSHSG